MEQECMWDAKYNFQKLGDVIAYLHFDQIIKSIGKRFDHSWKHKYSQQQEGGKGTWMQMQAGLYAAVCGGGSIQKSPFNGFYFLFIPPEL